MTGDSIIKFHELRYSPHPDEDNLYGIVRWDTDDSLKVEKKVIEILQLLSKGGSVKDVAEKKNIAVDEILAVLKTLEKAHFIKSIDDVVIRDEGRKIKPWFSNIDNKWFRWVLYKPLIYGNFVFIVTGISVGFILIGIPSFKAFFWNSDLFIVIVSLFFSNILLLFMHELGHLFVTKAVGGEAMMRISYRYFFIVAETESYHLALTPKRSRYLVYIAGVVVDLFIISFIYWFLSAVKLFDLNVGSIYNFLTAIILVQIIGIIWEFNVFLETDMYNFLSDYLDIENLRPDAIKFIALHVKKGKVLLLPLKRILMFFEDNYSENSDDLRVFNKSGKRKLSIYVIVLIAGLVLLTLQLFFYIIPRDIVFVYEGFKDLIQAEKNIDIVLFVKAVVILGIVASQYFLLVYLKIKSKRW